MSIHFGAIRLLIKKQLKSCNNYCVFLAFTSTTLIFFFLLWQTQNEGLLWLFTNGLPLVGITYNSMNMLWTWVGRLSSHLMQKYLPAPGSIPWNRLCYFSFPCLETLQCYFVIWWLKDHWKICCSKKVKGRGCNTVEKVVTSNNKRPGFESSQRQNLFTFDCTEKTNIKKKRPFNNNKCAEFD